LGSEPSLADLAARVGSDEARLGRTILRINTIESTSPLSAGDNVDGATLPAALVPSEPPAPDRAYEEREVRERVRAAIAALPPRERKVIALYYYAEATMKQIGAEIGVNESRVSQLHARAVQRLRNALGADGCSEQGAELLKSSIVSFEQTMKRFKMAKAPASAVERNEAPGVVLPYKAPTPKPATRRSVPPSRVAAAAR
jgi:RNA polymerase sigma factor for flagellar operon FliA